jgi:hypothetical protein
MHDGEKSDRYEKESDGQTGGWVGGKSVEGREIIGVTTIACLYVVGWHVSLLNPGRAAAFGGSASLGRQG